MVIIRPSNTYHCLFERKHGIMSKQTSKYRITALYARLSNDDDLKGESNSIIHQKQMLEQYAMLHGLGNCQFYVDDGYSGE